MLDTLYKKAKGYDVEEVCSEYTIDADGNRQLTKEKRQIKHIPPDLSAIKAYMELSETEMAGMSNEELIREKERLLQELKKEETSQ